MEKMEQNIFTPLFLNTTKFYIMQNLLFSNLLTRTLTMKQNGARRHDEVNELVLKMMREEKKIVWRKPWVTQGGYIKHSDLTEYSIRNCFLLALQGVQPGSELIGYSAAIDEGGFVKKGEKGKFIYKVGLCKSKTKVDDEGNPVMIPFAKKLYVYDIDTQCEGVKRKRVIEERAHDRFDEAEKVLKEYCERCCIEFKENPACGAHFIPSRKLVEVPPLSRFESVAEYYSAVFHEIVHSTGIKGLLNRHEEDTKFMTFGSDDYSKEELVAEIGGLYALSEFGIEDKCQFRNSVGYIEGWYERLKNETNLFEWALQKAEEAVHLIFNRTKEYNNDDEKQEND